MSQIFDPQVWAQEQFGTCQLGDRRRTDRVVIIAAAMAQNSAASTPTQCDGWSDLKATYRLFDNSNVSFQELIAPHRQMARQQCRGTVLVVSDTTEFDFRRKTIEGTRPTGNGSGRGFFLHSALYVGRADGEVIGIAAQKIFYRQSKPKGETSYAILQRARESQVWGEVVQDVGAAPEGVSYIHVCDRGADNFEFYCQLVQGGWGWVVRVAKAHRNVVTVGTDPQRVALDQFLTKLPVKHVYSLEVPAQDGQPKRTATLELRASRVCLPRPAQCSNWVKQHGEPQIEMSAVEVREINAPQGATPLHWIVLSSEPCNTSSQALQIVRDYEKRWVIEDFHKGLKTGCQMESRQYMKASRLERVLGIVAVVAIRLLKLRAAARQQPDEPASRHIPQPYLVSLCAIMNKNSSSRQAKRAAATPQTLTNREFYRRLAQLGGFIGRKSDGEPGWQTLWRGFEKLHNMVCGYQNLAKGCG